MTTTAVRTHHFVEKPTEIAGETAMAMVCEDCGTRMAEAEEGEECYGASLDEPDEVRSGTPLGSASQAQQFDTAGEHELPAPAPRLPFPAPPFDSEKALERIFSKRHAVNAARATWEKKQAQAKEAKGELEAIQKDLEELIETFEQDKHEAEASVAPRLVPNPVASDEERAADSALLVCSYEKASGERCYRCRPVEGEAPAPLEDEHNAEAGDAFRAYVAVLHTRLAEVGYVVHIADLETASDSQVEAAQLYVEYARQDQSSLIERARPGFLGEAHVASEPGASVQGCTRCGNVLRDLVKGAEALAAGTFVGIGCEGSEAVAQDDEVAAPKRKKGSRK